MAPDWNPFENVSAHVTSHHRNDEKVLEAWMDILFEYLRPDRLQKMPLDAWKAIEELAGLLMAKSSWYEAVRLYNIYGRYLMMHNLDYVPILQKILDDGFDAFYYVHKELKPAYYSLMMDRLKDNPKNMSQLLGHLLEDGVNCAESYVRWMLFENEKATDHSRFMVTKSLVKYPIYKSLLEELFPRLKFNYRNIANMWRNRPELIIGNLKHSIQAIILDKYVREIFVSDQKMCSFYDINGKIVECVVDLWNADLTFKMKRNALRILSFVLNGEVYLSKTRELIGDDADRVKLIALSVQFVKIDMENYLSLIKQKTVEEVRAKTLSLAVYTPMPKLVACDVTAIVRAASIPNATGAVEKTIGSVEELPVAALRFLWFSFLNFPTDSSWKMLERASRHCNIVHVVRNLQVKDAPNEFVGRLVNLVWPRLDSPKRRIKFISKIPKEKVKFIATADKIQMLECCQSDHLVFAAHCWLSEQTNEEIRSALLKLRREYGQEKIGQELLSAGYFGPFEDVVDVVGVPWSIRLRLEHLFKKCPESFHLSVLEEVNSLPMPEMMWHFVTDALQFINFDVQFLSNLCDCARNNVGLIVSAKLLSEKSHLPGPYVVDNEIVPYEQLLKKLKTYNDVCIQASLQPQTF